jgi:hypothetical protein
MGGKKSLIFLRGESAAYDICQIKLISETR